MLVLDPSISRSLSVKRPSLPIGDGHNAGQWLLAVNPWHEKASKMTERFDILGVCLCVNLWLECFAYIGVASRLH